MHAEFSNEIFLKERFLPAGENLAVELCTVERVNSSDGSKLRRETSSSMLFPFELFPFFFGVVSTAVTDFLFGVFLFFLLDGMFVRSFFFDCRKKENSV